MKVLGDYFTLQRGNTYKSALLGRPGPVLLGLGSIARNGGFRGDNLKSYGGPSDPRVLLKPGDIYVSLKDVTQSADLLGAVARVPPTVDQGRLTQDTVKLVFRSSESPEDYLYWLLQTPDYRAYCKAHSTGTTNLGLAREDFLAFPVPELTPTRQWIVDVVRKVEDKIELNRRMNETLEAMAQAIFRDWFIDFGPVRRKLAGETDPVAIMGGLSADPARAAEVAGLFPATLGEDGLPEGWTAGAAGTLIEFNPREPLRKGAAAPYSDMSSLPTVGSNADLPIMRDFGSGMRFRNGDALLARITPCLENGKAAFVDFLTEEFPVGWGSTEFIVHRARPGTPRALPYLLCRNDDYRSHAIQSMTGTSGRQRAQAESLEAWPMAIPTGPVLDAFSAFVDAFFDRISANGRENRTLAETRDYLLPRLMSGEVRVAPSNTASAAA